MWIPFGERWVEVRSNVSGLLGSLDLPYGKPNDDGSTIEGGLSLVIRDPSESRGVRRLPMVWLEAYPLFADRSLDVVKARMTLAGQTVVDAASVPTYMLYAAQLDGAWGLYGRDLFERSTYRRKLMRLGLDMSPLPFVILDENGFQSPDGDPFTPRFALLGGGDDDPDRAEWFGGALVPFTISSYRFGPAGPDEIRRIVRYSSDITALGANRPEVAIAALRERLGADA